VSTPASTGWRPAHPKAFGALLATSADLRAARAALWARTFDTHDLAAADLSTPPDTYSDRYGDIYGAVTWKPLPQADPDGRHLDYANELERLAGPGHDAPRLRRAGRPLALGAADHPVQGRPGPAPVLLQRVHLDPQRQCPAVGVVELGGDVGGGHALGGDEASRQWCRVCTWTSDDDHGGGRRLPEAQRPHPATPACRRRGATGSADRPAVALPAGRAGSKARPAGDRRAPTGPGGGTSRPRRGPGSEPSMARSSTSGSKCPCTCSRRMQSGSR